MSYNELFDNSNINPFLNTNQTDPNESNYENNFLKIFSCNNNKNEFQESPCLYYKKIEMNPIENISTNMNTNNVIKETSFELIQKFNCKKKKRNLLSLDSNNIEINYTKNNSPNTNTNEIVNNTSFAITLNNNYRQKGRKKKLKNNNNNINNCENLDNNTNSFHNKYCLDNQISKFKTNFYQNFLISISNIIIEKYFGEKEKFLKSNKEVITKLNIKENLKLLNSQLKDFLSFDISNKYDKDAKHNKRLMEKYINKNKYINFLFETKIDALYKIFINDNCKDILKSLFTIDCDLSLKSLINSIKDDDQKYKTELENTWKNIYSFFDETKIRNKKKLNLDE